MRILYLGNNRVGWQVLSLLKEHNDDVVGLVVHPQDSRRFGDEILSVYGLSSDYVFNGSQLRNPEVIERIEALEAEIAISVSFDYILRPELIGLFPKGVLNLHPSYLPYNRGQYPNVWSIVEGTPAGVTLHYIDAGIDTGDIVAQREVLIEPVDTGESLFRKLEQTSVELFRENWMYVRAGLADRIPQGREQGTYHRTHDVEQVDEIHLEQQYTAKELINVIRARTFPPYSGAYFVENGRKVYLRLQLFYEDELR